jgi:hypothetical protein
MFLRSSFNKWLTAERFSTLSCPNVAIRDKMPTPSAALARIMLNQSTQELAEPITHDNLAQHEFSLLQAGFCCPLAKS